MNLIEVVSKLKVLKNKLNLGAEKRNDNTYRIYNWMDFSNTLNLLKEFTFLEDQVNYIFSIDDNINIRNSEWIAKFETYSKMSYSIDTLKKSIDSCIKLIEVHTSEGFEIPENSGLINVKMPEIIDMVKMSDICNDIDIVFAQCPLIKDEVKFIGVEKGSVLFVFVTAVTSVKAIGMILNIALDVQKKYFQNQLLKNKLETMTSIKDSVEKAMNELDNEVKEYCKKKIMSLDESKNLDAEEQTRLILSIETLSDLIIKGVQMECALGEGEGGDNDVVSSFPKLEDFKNIIEATKLIE